MVRLPSLRVDANIPFQRYSLIELHFEEFQHLNAFHVAIVLKKAKVLQFAINNLNVPIRFYGRQPATL